MSRFHAGSLSAGNSPAALPIALRLQIVSHLPAGLRKRIPAPTSAETESHAGSFSRPARCCGREARLMHAPPARPGAGSGSLPVPFSITASWIIVLISQPSLRLPLKKRARRWRHRASLNCLAGACSTRSRTCPTSLTSPGAGPAGPGRQSDASRLPRQAKRPDIWGVCESRILGRDVRRTQGIVSYGRTGLPRIT